MSTHSADVEIRSDLGAAVHVHLHVHGACTSVPRRRTRRVVASVVVAMMLVTAACSSDDPATPGAARGVADADDTAPTSEPPAGEAPVTVAEPLDVDTGCTGYDPAAGEPAAPAGPSLLPERGDAPVESPDPYFVADWTGRVLLPRGTNVISAAKGAPDRLGGVDEEVIRVLAEDHGFNVVRHLIFWDAIEPAQGTYNERYLDLVEQRLDWYAAHGVHVILDMHQDIWSACFTGDGAPAWATITDGVEFEVAEGAPWWMNNTHEAVQNATMNFFLPERGHPALREAYAAMWAHVAERFKDHPAVLGYDIMNEPSFNSLGTAEEAAATAREAAVTGDYRNAVLTSFMQENVDAIRSVDPHGYIAIAPTSLVNTLMVPGDLAPITDPRSGPPRLIYGPHLYDPRAHEGEPYARSEGYVALWEQLRLADLDTLGGALWIGEFGSGEVEGIDDYFFDITEMADRLLIGWAHWSWDAGGWGLRTELPDGAETPHADRLTLPYARAIAGVPTSLRWDRTARMLEVSWDANPDATGPTEIYLPARHFPDGWAAVLDGRPLESAGARGPGSGGGPGDRGGGPGARGSGPGGRGADEVLVIEADGEAHELCVAPTVGACQTRRS